MPVATLSKASTRGPPWSPQRTMGAFTQDRGRERVTCPSQGEQVRPSPKPACLGSEPSLAPSHRETSPLSLRLLICRMGITAAASLAHKSTVRVKVENRHTVLRTGPNSHQSA